MSAQKKSTEPVSFGNRSVDAAEKSSLVKGVFDSVAGNYDLMNDLMSGGVHRIWKAVMIDWLAPRPGTRLLDVAGGTGDIAERFLKRAGGGAHAVICDLTYAMLAEGRARQLENTDWVNGNGENLPFPDDSFDLYTIAFGIRNVTHIEKVLAEAYRVLRPGGRFMCLEFSRVEVPGLDALYDAFSFQVIPRIGQLIAKDRDSYQYLVESIRQFPPQDTFAGMISAAGFGRVRVRNLSGGIAALHSGWVI